MHIGLQTEYSFGKCYGKVTDILDKIKGMGHSYAGIADYGNTFGHVTWERECKKRGIKPLFGVRLNVVPDGSKQRRCDTPSIIIAENQNGLIELNKLVEMSYDMFYYIPRIFESDISELKNCIVFSWYTIPLNRYVNAEDYPLYQAIAGSVKRGSDYNYMFEDSTEPNHILTTEELEKYYPLIVSNFDNCVGDITIPKAGMVKFEGDHDIERLCVIGALNKDVDLDDHTYRDRLNNELDLIKDLSIEQLARMDSMSKEQKNEYKTEEGKQEGYSPFKITSY